MSKETDQFLTVSKAILDALDEAKGLPSRHLECLHNNFVQLTSGMVIDALLRETLEDARLLHPMRRHDWGALEFPEAKKQPE